MADNIRPDPAVQASILKMTKDLNVLLEKTNSLRLVDTKFLTQKVDYLKKIGAYEQAEVAHAKDTAAQQLKRQKTMEEYIAAQKDLNALSEKQEAHIRQANKLESDRFASVSKYNNLLDTINVKYDKQIEKLKAQGSYIRANAKEWATKQFGLNEANGFQGQGVGNVAAGGARVYSGLMNMNPEDSIVAALGPWGELIKIIIGTVDQVRKLGAGLQSAAGATGEFSKGINSFKQLANSMASKPFQFGMTADEVAKDAETLAQAGIKISDTLGANGAMSKSFIDLEAFASTTGQDLGVVGKQFATLINTFKLTGTEASATYKHMYDTAQSFTKTFDVTMGDMVNSIMSVAEAVQDLGITVDDVSDLFTTLKNTAKGTKLGLADINLAASQLASVGKTADVGWQAFMGIMGGHASGGFLGGLGAFQQRGAGFLLPKMGDKNLDPGKQLEMIQSFLSTATRGMSDPKAKQFMQEQIAGQVGISPEVTEILQKMQTGQLTKAQGADQMKDLIKTMQDNKITNKGLLDILMTFLKTYLTDPIRWIYQIILRMGSEWPFGGSSSGMPASVGGGVPKADMGASIVTGGLMMVHGGEDVVPNAAKVRPRMSSSNTSMNQPININMHVSMNERDIHKAFMDAEDKMLRVVRNTKQRLAM